LLVLLHYAFGADRQAAAAVDCSVTQAAFFLLVLISAAKLRLSWLLLLGYYDTDHCASGLLYQAGCVLFC
jgi:hypothetical protein